MDNERVAVLGSRPRNQVSPLGLRYSSRRSDIRMTALPLTIADIGAGGRAPKLDHEAAFCSAVVVQRQLAYAYFCERAEFTLGIFL